jgi:hypothetical protein
MSASSLIQKIFIVVDAKSFSALVLPPRVRHYVFSVDCSNHRLYPYYHLQESIQVDAGAAVHTEYTWRGEHRIQVGVHNAGSRRELALIK